MLTSATPRPAHLTTVVHVLFSVLLLLAGQGCGRAPVGAAGGQAASPPAGAPTREDFAAFVRANVLPPTALLRDIQSDAPQPDPERPGAWTMNAKVTFAPKEDLYRSADDGERKELDSLTERYNKIVGWRNGFAATRYGRLGVFADLPTQAPKVRPLLVATLKAGSPLPAGYVKMRATRQVDRWRWEPLDADVDAAEKAEAGSARRAAYAADALVLGTPEATAFMDEVRRAVADAETWKAGVERDYAARLREAARTGATYRGEVACGSWGRAPVELHFTAGPPATANQEPAVACEVVVTSNPAYRFSYEGTLYLGPPNDPNAQNNLVLAFSKSDGKDYPGNKLPPEVLMVHQLTNAGRSQRYFLLIGPDGTLSGGIAPGIAGGFQLTATVVK